jgi:hypothetical protein
MLEDLDSRIRHIEQYLAGSTSYLGHKVAPMKIRPGTDSLEESVEKLLWAFEEFDHEQRAYIHHKIMAAVDDTKEQKDAERMNKLNRSFEQLKKCKWAVVRNVFRLPDTDAQAILDHLLVRNRDVSDWTITETQKVISAGVGLESEDELKDQILNERIPMQAIRNAIYAEVENLSLT